MRLFRCTVALTTLTYSYNTNLSVTPKTILYPTICANNIPFKSTDFIGFLLHPFFARFFRHVRVYSFITFLCQTCHTNSASRLRWWYYGERNWLISQLLLKYLQYFHWSFNFQFHFVFWRTPALKDLSVLAKKHAFLSSNFLHLLNFL